MNQDRAWAATRKGLFELRRRAGEQAARDARKESGTWLEFASRVRTANRKVPLRYNGRNNSVMRLEMLE